MFLKVILSDRGCYGYVNIMPHVDVTLLPMFFLSLELRV